MERVAENPLQLLRRANCELEQFFTSNASIDVAGTQAELTALLQVESVLCAVGATLQDLPENPPDGELHDELAAYGRSLLRLQRELAAMQTSASNCRARLFVRQKHLHAAKAWCDTARAVR